MKSISLKKHIGIQCPDMTRESCGLQNCSSKISEAKFRGDYTGKRNIMRVLHDTS